MALEVKFRDLPSTDNLRSDMEHLTARPHNVGSPYDKENADWLLSKFQEWGFDAHIETFYVLFPTPKERKLELIEPAEVHRDAGGASHCGRPHFESTGGAAPDL